MESFEVENFRSLKHLKLEKLARVNLLVGKSNSGKTSVLEGLWALRSIRLSQWLTGIEAGRGLEVEKGDFRQLFYQFDGTLSIRLAVKYANTTKEKAFLNSSMSLSKSASGDWSVRRGTEQLTRRTNATNALAISINLSDSLIPQPVKIELLRADDGSTFLVPVSQGAEDFIRNPIPLPRHYGTGFVTTSIDRSDLSQDIEQLKVDKKDEALLRIIQQIDPRIMRIELVTGGQIYLDLGESFTNLVPLNLMGEGVQRLLEVTAAIIQMPGGVVMIDEIDNGQHYSTLRILWKAILQAAREYDVQVFATTHSAEALRHLTWVLDDEENAIYRDDVAAYTLIRAGDDTVRSYRYGAEQLEYALEHDIEVRN